MSDRLYFGTIDEVLDPPNLIEVQIESYKQFLQKDEAPSKSKMTGLQAVFKEVFPIDSYDEKVNLDFVKYEVGPPKLTALEAQRDGESFSAPLYVTFKLKDEATGTKEEKVYMGELPLMTQRGTFVINGAERVVVSQLHRSPGRLLRVQRPPQRQTAPRLPHHSRTAARGWRCSSTPTTCSTSTSTAAAAAGSSWRRPSCARSVSPTDEAIIKEFYKVEKLKLSAKADEEMLSNKVVFSDILDDEIIIAKAYEPLTIGVVRQLMELGHKTIEVIDTREDDILIKSLKKDPAADEEEALKDIYRRLRPGDPPTVNNAKALLKRLFFDPKKYDLTRVGRYKINQKLGLEGDDLRRPARAHRRGFSSRR